MEFKLDVAIEHRHIDSGSKDTSEKDPIWLAIWDAAKKTPPFGSIWELVVDLTGIILYVGTDPSRWYVYCADCPDEVSELLGHLARRLNNQVE